MEAPVGSDWILLLARIGLLARMRAKYLDRDGYTLAEWLTSRMESRPSLTDPPVRLWVRSLGAGLAGADRGHGVVSLRPADLWHVEVRRSLGLVVSQLSQATLR